MKISTEIYGCAFTMESVLMYLRTPILVIDISYTIFILGIGIYARLQSKVPGMIVNLKLGGIDFPLVLPKEKPIEQANKEVDFVVTYRVGNKTIRMVYVAHNHPEAYVLVEKAIVGYQPDIMMLEADKHRCRSEMRHGLNVAMDCGIPVILGDRDGDITLARMVKHRYSQGYGLFNSIRWGWSILRDASEKHTYDEDLQTFISKVDDLPSYDFDRPLVEERDAIMAHVLKSIDKNSILGVVGAAHRRGIEKFLSKDDSFKDTNIKSLMTCSTFWSVFYSEYDWISILCVLCASIPSILLTL